MVNPFVVYVFCVVYMNHVCLPHVKACSSHKPHNCGLCGGCGSCVFNGSLGKKKHMNHKKTPGGMICGSCGILGLHGGGNCGLCVFVVYVVEANVVYVKPPKTHGGGICGLCETTKNT